MLTVVANDRNGRGLRAALLRVRPSDADAVREIIEQIFCTKSEM
jgi:hypothetical protein